MSEKPEFNSGAPTETPTGAPAETHTEAQPSDVSRETVDLIEIMDRSLPKAPDPPEKDPETEAPPRGEAAPPPAEGAPPSPPGKNRPSSFYVYLAVLFGAAFLMLLLAYFVQRRNNETVQDNLRTTIASREELMERIEELEADNEWLQRVNQDLTERFRQAQTLNDNYEQEIDDAQTKQMVTRIHRERAELLFYLDRFLANRDYEMAAVVAIMGGEWCFQGLSVNGEYVPINQAQMAQFNACRKRLEEKGYIRPLDSDIRSDAYTFTDAYDLEENPDMAALNVIWEELYTYYVRDGYFSAALLIIEHQDEGLEEKAGPYTAGLYEQLIQDMTAMGYLRVREDGRLDCGDALEGATVVFYGTTDVDIKYE